MTLIVEADRRDPETGAMIDLDHEPGEQLAGFERWRHVVWGAAVMQDLGLTLLPSLATRSEIHAEGPVLERLGAELDLVAPTCLASPRSSEWTRTSSDAGSRTCAPRSRARRVEDGSGGVYIG